MIYASSLSALVKLAYPEVSIQTNMNNIAEIAPQDPKISQCHVIVIGPKDVAGGLMARIRMILTRDIHEDVNVVYFYKKDKEEGIINGDRIIKIKMPKDSAEIVKKELEPILENIQQNVGSTQKPRRVSQDVVGDPSVQPLNSRILMQYDTQPETKGSELSGPARDMQPMTSGSLLDNETPKPQISRGIRSIIGEDGNLIEDKDQIKKVMTEERELQQREAQMSGNPAQTTYDVATSRVINNDTAHDRIHLENGAQVPISTLPTGGSDGVLTPEEKIYRNTKAGADFDMAEFLSTKKVEEALLRESAEYSDTITILNALDLEIKSILNDKSLTDMDRLKRIRQRALDRTELYGKKNNAIVDRFCNIFNVTIAAMEDTVNRQVEEVRKGLDIVMDASRSLKENPSEVHKRLEHKAKLQMELTETKRKMIDLLMTVDVDVKEFAEKGMTDGLPSSNELVNSFLMSEASLYEPANTKMLAYKLVKATQDGALKFSQLESLISEAIDQIFAIAEYDNSSLEYIEKINAVLRCQRVEDIVIIDSIIKKYLRVYTGQRNTGLSATAYTYARLKSRSSNTLVIDLTDKPKNKRYGEEAISLRDFMDERIERHFLAVTGKIDNVIEMTELINVISKRITYFSNIVMIIEDHKHDLLNEACKSAISINFVTNGTIESLEETSKTVEAIKVENVSRKLIAIDSTLPPLELANRVGLSVIDTRVITIPHMSQIKACAMSGQRPSDLREVAVVLEEAFR